MSSILLENVQDGTEVECCGIHAIKLYDNAGSTSVKILKGTELVSIDGKSPFVANKSQTTTWSRQTPVETVR